MRQDGRSSSLTAPNGQAQQRLFIAALGDAGIVPSELAWCEAHGTGTKLGDPIESASLRAAIINGASCIAMGGLKANTGHTEGASGIPGLLKTETVVASRRIIPNALLRC